MKSKREQTIKAIENWDDLREPDASWQECKGVLADRILEICKPDREMIAEEILKDREDVLNYSVKGHVLARSPKDVANEIIRQWREDEGGGEGGRNDMP